MMGRRREDRELYWRGVLQQQTESGLSVAEFCRQESVSAPSFYHWRRKFRQRDAEAHAESQRSDVGASAATQLLPVKIESPGGSAAVRVLLPQGVAIDAPHGTDPGALADLLRALREAQLC